jgi:hypothetical protein
MTVEGRSLVQSSVERKIQEAITNGVFDDLPGKGKPLQLEDETHVDPGMRLAYRILRKAGMAPGWLEKQKEVRVEIDQARAALHQAMASSRSEMRGEACERFREKCIQLNKAINTINLEASAISLQLQTLNIERELMETRFWVGMKKDQS